MLGSTITEGWKDDVESWEEAEGWKEDVESWKSWEETESWKDDADVELFRIWSWGGVERGAVGWDHSRGVKGVEGVREILAVLTCSRDVEGCHGVVSVEEVLAALWLRCCWCLANWSCNIC